jgi:hypothetical protein
MERLCFSAEHDQAFARTPAQPRLPPPVLGRDGKISFPPCAGFGESAPPAPYVPPSGPAARMQFVPASGQPDAHNPPARPTIDVTAAPVAAQDGGDSAYPATPKTPVTPQTPTTPTTPGEHARPGWTGSDVPEGEQADHPPRSPEMPPDGGGAAADDDAASFAPGMDDAASFAPGTDDDAGNFAPGADYAAPASSDYGNEYAPGSSPQVCRAVCSRRAAWPAMRIACPRSSARACQRRR